nr:MAG TPA: adhesin [Bacteriophage sp.]
MKKVILIMVAALTALTFTGCASTAQTDTPKVNKVRKQPRVRCDNPIPFPGSIGQDDYAWYQEQVERQLEECSKNR